MRTYTHACTLFPFQPCNPAPSSPSCPIKLKNLGKWNETSKSWLLLWLTWYDLYYNLDPVLHLALSCCLPPTYLDWLLWNRPWGLHNAHIFICIHTCSTLKPCGLLISSSKCGVKAAECREHLNVLKVSNFHLSMRRKLECVDEMNTYSKKLRTNNAIRPLPAQIGLTS